MLLPNAHSAALVVAAIVVMLLVPYSGTMTPASTAGGGRADG